MSDEEWLADRFQENRGHLRAVAYRMLGSVTEADDAVQESWLRLQRSDIDEVRNLGGWLTTVVARVCLDMLRSRSARREEPLEAHEGLEVPASLDSGADPEHQALLADSVGLALLVVLDTLAPAERLAFVLHDLFGVPFDEIAPIVERSPEATRQLASRARRRVQHTDAAPQADLGRRRAVVDAFLAASRGGDFEALLALLDPDVVLRRDTAMVRAGAPSEVFGAAAVAETFSGRARAAQPALIDGEAGAVWAPNGRPRVVFGFTIRDGRILEIEMFADPARVGRLDLTIVESSDVLLWSPATSLDVLLWTGDPGRRRSPARPSFTASSSADALMDTGG